MFAQTPLLLGPPAWFAPVLLFIYDGGAVLFPTMAPNPTLQVGQRGAAAGGAREDDAVLPFAVSGGGLLAFLLPAGDDEHGPGGGRGQE